MGVGIWDLALIPHKMPDYNLLFSSFEHKNRSHGGKSIFHVDKKGVMRNSHRKVSVRFVGKS